MSDIEAKVKAIIAKELSVSEDKIGPSSSFVDDLGADSLDQVELMMAFEEAFDLKEIPSEDAEKLRTVSDAVEYLTGKV
ncbi:MAG: acyl carrier protein [Chitinispirillales bacterium]|jgi:acyl carrier protein|nr:acyl carrier protein [Chitinispirillales bacterium]